MIKLAALGALGYAGYKYYQKNAAQSGGGDKTASRNAAAGGPLSDKATARPAPPVAH
ncbi:MAG: hypothetical protein KKE69_01925 [Alphaproteobacteria bacterium]|nr:hypothetical protein [Alphaproteobacteria bacterium]